MAHLFHCLLKLLFFDICVLLYVLCLTVAGLAVYCVFSCWINFTSFHLVILEPVVLYGTYVICHVFMS
jgi:hypothetical protein